MSDEEALCCECAEDQFLQTLIDKQGEDGYCSICKSQCGKTISADRLGQLLEPILRTALRIGRLGYREEQMGDLLEYFVAVALGQDEDSAFVKAVVKGVCDSDDYWPPDGGEAYWDETQFYEAAPVHAGRYTQLWRHTQEELRHTQRYFSPSAQAFFSKLFSDVHVLQVSGHRVPPTSVAKMLPAGSILFRSRVMDSSLSPKQIVQDPLKAVGPPPALLAKAGRMNAEGIPVFYGAITAKTALSEVRPAMGQLVATIEVRTRSDLLLLDFSMLEKVSDVSHISYFDPDRQEKIERREFLRVLHSRITTPVIPGQESEYLITQAMAEYLAHLHHPRFDGIEFRSAQDPGGANVVLFPSKLDEILLDKEEPSAARFDIDYVDDSVGFRKTKAIDYLSEDLKHQVHPNGDVLVGYQDEVDYIAAQEWNDFE